jgi:hypothetical protein
VILFWDPAAVIESAVSTSTTLLSPETVTFEQCPVIVMVFENPPTMTVLSLHAIVFVSPLPPRTIWPPAGGMVGDGFAVVGANVKPPLPEEEDVLPEVWEKLPELWKNPFVTNEIRPGTKANNPITMGMSTSRRDPLRRTVPHDGRK